MSLRPQKRPTILMHSAVFSKFVILAPVWSFGTHSDMGGPALLLFSGRCSFGGTALSDDGIHDRWEIRHN